MGGNALKNTETVRVDSDTYFTLWNDINHHLRQLDVHYELIPAYASKQSFGDMDILYKSEDGRDIIQEIVDILHPHEVVRNGDVTSMDYMKLQIDFIKVHPDEFSFALRYFSFNDLGNLIGRIAHKMGLKFGHTGLLYPYRVGDKVLAEIVVTRDYFEALNICGYPSVKTQFRDLVDIFEFVTSSKYFNPDIYLLDNRNAKARQRDSKRESYMKFLQYCESNKDTLPRYEFSDKASYLPALRERFPLMDRDITIASLRETIHNSVKTRYNGNLVRDIIREDGESLGTFMAFVKNTLSDPSNKKYHSVEDMVLFNSDESIRQIINALYLSFKYTIPAGIEL